MLDVSVVIVSFNTMSLLEGCLSSLYGAQHERTLPAKASTSMATEDVEALAGPLPYQAEALAGPSPGQEAEASAGAARFEVIVVDNASTDGSPAMVASKFPQVRLIANDENRGFAAANNQAIRAAAGRYVLLLNSDTVVLGDAIPQLVAFLDLHPDVAVASAQLENPDGSHQHSVFRFPGLLMTFFDFFPMNHRLYNSRLNGRYPRPHDGRPFEIDHPLGACMMVRREAIDAVGMLDEQFFMYCEEIDWCLRIGRQGWRLCCLPTARVVHYGSQSARQFRSAMYAELFKSRARLFRKHRSALFCLAAETIMKVGFWREGLRARGRFRAGLVDADGLAQELEMLRRAKMAVERHV